MPSEAESLLAWQLDAAGIPYIREYRFHPERQWRLDFAVGDLRPVEVPGETASVPWVTHYRQIWAVEIEGGTWSGGRHTRGAGFEEDCEKYNEAAMYCWRVLRVTPQMVRDGRALALIARVVAGQRE
jgi:hypothetical protein